MTLLSILGGFVHAGQVGWGRARIRSTARMIAVAQGQMAGSLKRRFPGRARGARYVEDAVVQGFRGGFGQLTVQRKGLETGMEIGGQHRRGQPGGVNAHLQRGQQIHPGHLLIADPCSTRVCLRCRASRRAIWPHQLLVAKV